MSDDSITKWIADIVMLQTHRSNLIDDPHMIVGISYEGASMYSTSQRRDALVLYAMDKDWYPEATDKTVVKGVPRLKFEYLRRIQKENEDPKIEFFNYWHYMPKPIQRRLDHLVSSRYMISDEFKDQHNKLIGIVEDFIMMPIDEFTAGNFSYV